MTIDSLVDGLEIYKICEGFVIFFFDVEVAEHLGQVVYVANLAGNGTYGRRAS